MGEFVLFVDYNDNCAFVTKETHSPMLLCFHFVGVINPGSRAGRQWVQCKQECMVLQEQNRYVSNYIVLETISVEFPSCSQLLCMHTNGKEY